MKKYIIHNRENQVLWFEEVSDNLYIIKSTSNYALKYASINYDNVDNIDEADFSMTDQFGITHFGKISSFDPSGGPYISVGNYKINDKVVKRIYEKDNNIYFET